MICVYIYIQNIVFSSSTGVDERNGMILLIIDGSKYRFFNQLCGLIMSYMGFQLLIKRGIL